MSVEILDPVATVEQAAPGRRRLSKIGWLGWVSIAVIVVALLLALLGPLVRPFDPNSSDLSFANVGPFGPHLLGFDGEGRDVLSRLLVGAPHDGLRRRLRCDRLRADRHDCSPSPRRGSAGRFDASVSVGIDVLFAFPGILLAVDGRRRLRAEPVLGRRSRCRSRTRRTSHGCCAAPRCGARDGLHRGARGAGLRRVAAVRAAPAAQHRRSLIVAQGTILFGFAMVDLAAISFLGLGVQSPQADWGVMVSEGKTRRAAGLPARVAVGRAVHRRGGGGRQLPRRPARRLLEGRAPMSALLEVHDLTVALQMDSGPREVITGTSLSIAEGEAMGLVGESGSGKSMTAKAIARLLPKGAVTTGSISFDGVDVLALDRQTHCAVTAPRSPWCSRIRGRTSTRCVASTTS